MHAQWKKTMKIKNGKLKKIKLIVTNNRRK
jgi:hypothetical protein